MSTSKSIMQAGSGLNPILETPQRKGPSRATVSSARFLPQHQRMNVYRLFHNGKSVEQLSSTTGLKRLLIQEILRDVRLDELYAREVGRAA